MTICLTHCHTPRHMSFILDDFHLFSLTAWYLELYIEGVWGLFLYNSTLIKVPNSFLTFPIE